MAVISCPSQTVTCKGSTRQNVVVIDMQRNACNAITTNQYMTFGETSAMDVVRTDSQEELDRKIGQINEDFAGRDKEAAGRRAQSTIDPRFCSIENKFRCKVDF